MNLCKLCDVEIKVGEKVSMKNLLMYHTECWDSFQEELDKALKSDLTGYKQEALERLSIL